MEKIIIFLFIVNSLIIAIDKALSNVNKVLDNYIALRKKIAKIKNHPNGNSDDSEENF